LQVRWSGSSGGCLGIGSRRWEGRFDSGTLGRWDVGTLGRWDVGKRK
jgi:hypothetical protein